MYTYTHFFQKTTLKGATRMVHTTTHTGTDTDVHTYTLLPEDHVEGSHQDGTHNNTHGHRHRCTHIHTSSRRPRWREPPGWYTQQHIRAQTQMYTHTHFFQKTTLKGATRMVHTTNTYGHRHRCTHIHTSSRRPRWREPPGWYTQQHIRAQTQMYTHTHFFQKTTLKGATRMVRNPASSRSMSLQISERTDTEYSYTIDLYLLCGLNTSNL